MELCYGEYYYRSTENPPPSDTECDLVLRDGRRCYGVKNSLDKKNSWGTNDGLSLIHYDEDILLWKLRKQNNK